MRCTPLLSAAGLLTATALSLSSAALATAGQNKQPVPEADGDFVIKPPYAYIVAVDLNKGDIAWKVPFGAGSQAIRSHPLLQGVKLPERLGTGGAPGVHGRSH